jgi:hypothetical protein
MSPVLASRYAPALLIGACAMACLTVNVLAADAKQPEQRSTTFRHAGTTTQSIVVPEGASVAEIRAVGAAGDAAIRYPVTTSKAATEPRSTEKST